MGTGLDFPGHALGSRAKNSFLGVNLAVDLRCYWGLVLGVNKGENLSQARSRLKSGVEKKKKKEKGENINTLNSPWGQCKRQEECNNSLRDDP